MASAERTRTFRPRANARLGVSWCGRTVAVLVLAFLAGCGNALDTNCKVGCPAGTHGAATSDRRGCACVNDVDADVADADVADADVADADVVDAEGE